MIKAFGIRFRLHPLFTLMMVLSIATGFFVELLILFSIVLIHELGHVAAAKSFGWTVTKVELLPFGGVAETEELGRSTVKEDIAVALAGPLQNGWMVLVGFALHHWGIWSTEWSVYFIEANIMIGLFNLLPVLPLDGGKVLQALLSRWMPYYRAIQASTWTSIAMSGLLLIMALWQITNGGVALNLLIIAGFLLVSNWYGLRGASYQFVRFLTNRGMRMTPLIDKGTLAQPIVIAPHRSLSDIVQLFMREKYHIVYILGAGGGVSAVLPEQRLLEAYFNSPRPGSPVSDIFMLK
ncbi:M50 family metallopeptidase [Paenibacillus koleovorans]|uniref:M50 family metallopeptidase n=1 Tax=Paenibacillus koleovorans TaxID=121608 RepID=UPI001FEB38CB|nr:M50 family metallopeptidase [Paenibacillus koleovorans]